MEKKYGTKHSKTQQTKTPSTCNINFLEMIINTLYWLLNVNIMNMITKEIQIITNQWMHNDINYKMILCIEYGMNVLSVSE